MSPGSPLASCVTRNKYLHLSEPPESSSVKWIEDKNLQSLCLPATRLFIIMLITTHQRITLPVKKQEEWNSARFCEYLALHDPCFKSLKI